MKPFLPPDKPHPLGCHHPRLEDRKAAVAIFYRLRTGLMRPEITQYLIKISAELEEILGIS
jgi:hypothetical protein